METLRPILRKLEAEREAAWGYEGGRLLLAPMVRVNTLSFRLLAAECGADIVYSEELVDRSVLKCRRSVSAATGGAEFRHDDGKLIFSTVPHERVAFQLGSACAATALRAAQVVAPDVRAIDLNMGCPVKFSTAGGMGSALLSEPAKVSDILRTLVNNLGGMPVTAKIRLLDTAHETLALARVVLDAGVSALAVHARRRHDRPRHWAQWEQFELLRGALRDRGVPLILNGDVFRPQDVVRAFGTGADALMLARGAVWNPSIFAQPRQPPATAANAAAASAGAAPAGAPSVALRPQHEVVRRYVELAAACGNHVNNSKYVAMQMIEHHGKSRTFKAMQASRDHAGLLAAAEGMAADEHFSASSKSVASLEPPPDLPLAPTLPINAWREIPVHCRDARAARKRGLDEAIGASQDDDWRG